jgi:cell division protease FtsH
VSLVDALERAGIKTGPDGVNVVVKSSIGLGGLSLRVYGKRQEMVFLGKEITEERDYSDRIAEVIDNQVDSLIHHAYDKAKEVLATQRDKLDRLAKYLIQNEAAEGDMLARLLSGRPMPEPEEEPVRPDGKVEGPSREVKPQPTPSATPPRTFKPKPAPEA